MNTRIVNSILFTALLATVPTFAHAQSSLTIGQDARAMAMGGAGIGAGISGLANPAVLARGRDVRFQTPRVGLRAGGAIGNIGNLSDTADFFNKSGTALEDQVSFLARTYATQSSTFGLNLGTAFQVGSLEIGASGVASGKLNPNATLQNWANAGGIGLIPNGAGAEMSGVGVYTLPSVGLGIQLPAVRMGIGKSAPVVKMAVGARVKLLNAVYSRYEATVFSNGEFTSGPGSELGGESNLSRTGIATDIGVTGSTKLLGADWSAGFVTQNFVKPDLTFRDQNNVLIDPLVQTTTVGVAMRKSGLTLAGDIADFFGRQDMRLGAEQRFGPLALRAGYSSSRGSTYGVGLFGLDVAFGKGQPLELVKSIRF
jgi:hypothetical protein